MDMKRLQLALMALLIGGMGMASAVDVNWTEIADIVEGSTVIFAAVVAIVIAVVPVVLILAVVSFLTGIFSAILAGIQRKI